MPDVVKDYLAQTAEGQPEAVAWRLSCYAAGGELAEFIERSAFPLAGRNVLDVAAGWGGHIIAFAERGAHAVAAELNDHMFTQLAQFATRERLDLRAVVADCHTLPFPSASFDVILGLELIEHIDSVPRFADEVARLLKPGGVAIVSTPARVRSFFDGEPHFQLRFLTILPFRLQAVVARKVFKRRYPFPITRQYLRASSALRPFRRAGLQAETRWVGRMARAFGSTPLVGALGRELLFNFLIVRRA